MRFKELKMRSAVSVCGLLEPEVKHFINAKVKLLMMRTRVWGLLKWFDIGAYRFKFHTIHHAYFQLLMQLSFSELLGSHWRAELSSVSWLGSLFPNPFAVTPAELLILRAQHFELQGLLLSPLNLPYYSRDGGSKDVPDCLTCLCWHKMLTEGRQGPITALSYSQFLPLPPKNYRITIKPARISFSAAQWDFPIRALNSIPSLYSFFSEFLSKLFPSYLFL